MNLQARLVVIFIIIGCLFLFSSGTVTYLNNRQAETVDHLISNSSQAVTILNGLVIQLQKTRRYEKEYFIYIGHTSKKAKYIRDWRDSMDKVFATLQRLQADSEQLFDAEDNKLFQDWLKAARFYHDEFENIIRTYNNVKSVGKAAEEASSRFTVKANSSIKDGKNRLKTVFVGAEKVELKKQFDLKNARSQMKAQAKNMTYLSYTVSAISLLILLISMLYLRRSFIRYIR